MIEYISIGRPNSIFLSLRHLLGISAFLFIIFLLENSQLFIIHSQQGYVLTKLPVCSFESKILGIIICIDIDCEDLAS